VFTSGTRLEDGSKSPAIQPVVINFSADYPGAGGNVDGVIQLYKPEDILWPAFAKTGVYSYTVKESDEALDNASGYDEMSKSNAEYSLEVRVGNFNGELYVKDVVATVEKADNAGTAGKGTKVDATPGNGTTSFSGLQFTNRFFPNLHNKLSVETNVEGDMADKSKAFNVNVQLIDPLNSPVKYNIYLPYEVYLYDENNNPVEEPVTEYDSYAGTGYYLIGADSTPKTIGMKHGWRLVFDYVGAGTKFVVTQDASEFYIPNVAVSYNGQAAVSTNNAAANTAISTADVDASLSYVVSGGSAVTFTNAYDEVSPTGVVINNLPFIMLALLAIAALGISVIARSRRRGQEAR
jgi:hypothetical protein